MYQDFKTIESEWRKSSNRYSGKELLEILPAIKSELPKMLADQQNQYKTLEATVKSKLKAIPKDIDEIGKWIIKSSLKQGEIAEMNIIDKRIYRLKWLIKLATGKDVSRGNGMSQEDFEYAKSRSILEAIKPFLGKLQKSGTNTYKAICPFHDEKTPSFVIYISTNSFHCFSCKVGGNLIKFIMLFHDCDFIEAVKWLKEN